MNFNFSQTAGKSQNVAGKPDLKGNQIHTVLFKGCESKNIDKEGMTWKLLSLNFENKDGRFQKTYFEPKDDDDKDRITVVGDQEIKNPPLNVDMIYTFKHLIDAVNPELGKQIDDGTKQIHAPNWDMLRQFMVKATEPGIDKEIQIKLFQTKKGDAILPQAVSYARSGDVYMPTNFFGQNLFFSKKELERIKKTESKPDNMDVVTKKEEVVNPYQTVSQQEVGDLNFDL
jgi:hypothetical protein